NNDGLLDIFVANFSGQDRLYRNDGPPDYNFTLVSAEVSSYSNTGLGGDACDVDLDGDYDFLVGNDGGQANVFLLNTTQTPDTHAPRIPQLEQAPDRLPSVVPTVVRAHVYDNSSWNIAQFNVTTLEYRIDGGAVNVVPMAYAGGNLFRGEIPGNISGVITYQARSEDEHGNIGLSVQLAYNSGTCQGVISTYCTSKPSSIPGCVPTIGFSGTPSASAGNGFLVTAGPAPGTNPGLFLYTTNGSLGSPVTTPYGSLCVASPIVRFAGQISGGTLDVCDGQYQVDFNTFLATQTADPSLLPGATVDLQCWYRDPPNPGLANFSNAGKFQICP
ncbi:MAG TPA: VCBS repeat-containing protein, partial [Planctomycetota bacterium]|nr:VCBS repeat-containing protein [Planctomycetota bacterium]